MLFANSRVANEIITVDDVLNEYEFSELGQSQFQRLISVVPNEEDEEQISSFEELYVKMDNLTGEFNSDPNLPGAEISALNHASVLVRNEIEGLVEYVDEALVESNAAARCRFSAGYGTQ